MATSRVNVYTTSPFMLAILSKNPGIARAKINKGVRNSLTSSLFLWHRNFSPRHFQHGNMALYPIIAPRNPRYNKSKGNKPALVLSGKTRRMVGRGITPRVSSTFKRQRAKGVIRVPDYIMKNKKFGHPLSHEVVAHNDAEDKVLLHNTADEVDREVFKDTFHIPRLASSKSYSG
jgi:hypothetical protein